jgi:hypothetical protein
MSSWAKAKDPVSVTQMDSSAKASEWQVWEKLSTWWISPISDLDFFISKYTVNIAPKSLIQSHFENKISNIEIWLPIFKILEDKKNNSKKLVPLVWIAQIFWHLATQNVLEISDEQLELLMEKRDLNDERLKDYEWNFVILKRNGVGVWLISLQKWIWKNKCFQDCFMCHLERSERSRKCDTNGFFGRFTPSEWLVISSEKYKTKIVKNFFDKTLAIKKYIHILLSWFIVTQ